MGSQNEIHNSRTGVSSVRYRAWGIGWIWNGGVMSKPTYEELAAQGKGDGYSVDELFKLSKHDTDASKRAAEGFKERLKEREKDFTKESRKLTPSEGFYERVYDL